MPIIPDMDVTTSSWTDTSFPEFPTINAANIAPLQKQLEKRINLVSKVMRNAGSTLYWVSGTVLWFAKGWLSGKLMKMLKSSLEGHGVLKD
ncbi:MAG: hypothetical protein IPL65_03605 [Lewinellaceae bacterium]|nr:hypothetical protein [Lewinellaceae bacterium]